MDLGQQTWVRSLQWTRVSRPGVHCLDLLWWNTNSGFLSFFCISRKKKHLSPSAFKYEVKMMKEAHSEPFTVKSNQIR